MLSTNAVPVLLALQPFDVLTDRETLGRVSAVALTLVIAAALYVVLRRALSALLERNATYRFAALRILGWAYVPVVALIVLQELGVDVGHLWTVLSAVMAMVAVGFVAAWSLLSNVSAALMILSSRHFAVGDEVEVLEPTGKEGLRGKVADVGLLCTTLEHPTAGGTGRIVTKIPNNTFFQKALRVRYGGAELPVPAETTG